jgi:amidase
VEPVVDVVEAQLVAGRALGAASSILVDDERFAFAGAASDTLPRHGVTYAETLVCGTGDRHRSWLVDLEWRRAYEARWDRFFEDYDVVICPVSPVSAFPHQLDGVRGERRITIDGAIASYYAQLAWPALVSLAGLPATTVPVGRTPGGLPVGAQVIGPYLGDRTSLAFAGLLGMAVGAQVGGDLP